MLRVGSAHGDDNDKSDNARGEGERTKACGRALGQVGDTGGNTEGDEGEEEDNAKDNVADEAKIGHG